MSLLRRHHAARAERFAKAKADAAPDVTPGNATPSPYADWNGDKLRAECETRGLKKSGKKDDLIARLEAEDAQWFDALVDERAAAAYDKAKEKGYAEHGDFLALLSDETRDSVAAQIGAGTYTFDESNVLVCVDAEGIAIPVALEAAPNVEIPTAIPAALSTPGATVDETADQTKDDDQ